MDRRSFFGSLVGGIAAIAVPLSPAFPQRRTTIRVSRSFDAALGAAFEPLRLAADRFRESSPQASPSQAPEAVVPRFARSLLEEMAGTLPARNLGALP